jgi:FecR-like protein
MNSWSDDDRVDAYLWDPAAPAAADVRGLEEKLVAARFDPDAHPLNLPLVAARPRLRFHWAVGLAAAAAVVIVAVALLALWRWQWPAGRPWTIEAGSSTLPDRLAVGAPLLLSGSEQARINVARIGTLNIKGDARLTLQSTDGSRHRMALDRGTLHLRVWAPPGSVRVQTPAGDVIDLGCEFDLTVDNGGTTAVAVRSGWVLIANNSGETLVPAGAGSEMRVDRRPGVPLFVDAPPPFAAAVRSLEAGTADVDAQVDTIVRTARARDVLTLLVLVERRSPGRERIAVRAAELAPPPSGVTVDDVLRGDSEARERWRNTLRLPPPKGWLRNWRDGLPSWLPGSGR